MEPSRILVVEDEKIVVMDITKRLLNLGYSVVGTSSTGEDAIMKAEETKPDLVLMDIILKGMMDGIQAAEIISKKFDIPIVFLTASTDEMTFQKAKLVAPYGYIIKPFEVRDLKNVLETVLYKVYSERKIKEQQKIITATINNVDHGIISVDKDDKIILINTVALKILDKTEEKCLGYRLNDIYKTSIELPFEAIICGLNYKNSDGIGDFLKCRMLKLSKGIEKPIEENVSIIKNNFDEEIFRVISFRDLSNQFSLQKKIMVSHNYYLRLLEGFPVMVWRTNENGDFNYFNNCWLEFRDKKIEEDIIDRWIEGIHPDDKNMFINCLRTSINSRTKFEIEFKLLAGDGKYHHLYCYSAPYYSVDDDFEGMIGACFDITNRKIAEDKLTEAKNNIERAYKTKSDFLSNITHEIRTPINHIVGFLELLKITKLSNEQKNYVEHSINSTLSILRMFNSILDYSKIEAGKMDIISSNFNIRNLIRDICTDFSGLAKNKNIDLSYFVDSKIPEIIFMDKLKLQQILNNLISNSIKFTITGYVRVFINYQEVLNEKFILFKVQDTGIGVPSDKMGEIFNSFTQIDSSLTKKFSGTGLGLAIVKELVKILNGEIEVKSELKKGSEFIVKFKLIN